MKDIKQEIFDANKDLSEDEVIILIFGSEGNELTIKECQAEYRKMAIEAGMIKTASQRKAEWEDAIEDLDIATVECCDAAKSIATDLGISSTTYAKYLKAYASENGITLPDMPSRAPSKWNEVVSAFTAEEALDGDKSEVIDKINTIGEYNDIKKATSYYNRLRKAFGWEAPASMSKQICDWYTEATTNGTAIEKADIIEKALEIGMTEGSANYYVGVFKLAGEIIESLK